MRFVTQLVVSPSGVSVAGAHRDLKTFCRIGDGWKMFLCLTITVYVGQIQKSLNTDLMSLFLFY